MKVNDKLYGFTVRSLRELPEIDARLWEMEYDKNGAGLIWIDRPDENKTFAITFKTIPTDDTGVFHILEHSVLCGSRKYPMREPFVELIKSSLNTFLNALTFADKTMYPISSRNDQDYLNLMDVYLDATLHPLCVEKPEAFWQEGWHYETDAEGKTVLNGVVYNEMKGAYASPDRVLNMSLSRLLNPDNCYGFSSGGDPVHIPELTYEQYVANHRRYYHPSNARIVLDGAVKIEDALAKLDSFLCDFDRIRVEADIPLQKPVSPAEETVTYEIGEGEDPADKAILGGGWVLGDFRNQEQNMAASVLCDMLCGSNEAPLMRALLDKKLAQDVSLEFDDSQEQPEASLMMRNVRPENKDAAWAEVERVLTDLAENGIDREQLTASLNLYEFRTREKDFGSMPRGLVYAITAMTTWLYDGDPAQNLQSDAVFRSLRKKLNTRYFEDLIRKLFIDNPHKARVAMLPSVTLGEEKKKAEEARITAVTSCWKDTDRAETEEKLARLRLFQSTPDTPEQRATLPVLKLSDIPETAVISAPAVSDCEGVTLLRHNLSTGGIVYSRLYFSADDLTREELQHLTFLAGLLGDLGTGRSDGIAILNRVKSKLGTLSVSIELMAKREQTTDVTPYFTVYFSALPGQLYDALPLLKEILFETDFTDTASVGEHLRQSVIGLQQATVMGGNRMAATRAAAAFSAENSLNESLSGISYLRFLENAEKEERDWASDYASLSARVLSRDRLTVSVTGPAEEDWIKALIAIIPSGGTRGEKQIYTPVPAAKEGILIPAPIGFAVKCGHLLPLGLSFRGSMLVASQYLTYDYLWNSVRVAGGAYGTGMRIQTDGNVTFSSYRDPQAARSLGVYDKAGDALRALCDSDESIDRYIISTISAVEPLLTPRSESGRNDRMFLCCRKPEDLVNLRREILHTTREELRAAADAIDRVVADNPGICVVAGKAIMDACDGLLDSITPLA